MTAGLPDRAADRAREVCAHCGVEVRVTNYALGPRLEHSPYPHHDPYTFCKTTRAALAARPAPDDGGPFPGPLDDRCGCRRGMGRRDPACHSYGLCGHADSSPPTDALRQAVADRRAGR